MNCSQSLENTIELKSLRLSEVQFELDIPFNWEISSPIKTDTTFGLVALDTILIFEQEKTLSISMTVFRQRIDDRKKFIKSTEIAI
ncbi:MAG: hypothetical protein AAFO07_34270 [Bacteroidota bacterium]